MPQGVGYGPQPGIESIMQALAVGGQPQGNIANTPNPALPQGGLPGLPAQPGGAASPIGSANPLDALNGIPQDQIALILQALLAAGPLTEQQPETNTQ